MLLAHSTSSPLFLRAFLARSLRFRIAIRPLFTTRCGILPRRDVFPRREKGTLEELVEEEVDGEVVEEVVDLPPPATSLGAPPPSEGARTVRERSPAAELTSPHDSNNAR